MAPSKNITPGTNMMIPEQLTLILKVELSLNEALDHFANNLNEIQTY